MLILRGQIAALVMILGLGLSGCRGDKGSDNDKTPPTVSITHPASNAAVSGVVTITAEATDNIAVSQVDFYVGQQRQCSDSLAPWACEWDCTLLPDSTQHTLSARASDGSGNHGLSATVPVLVRSAGPSGDSTPPAAVINLAVDGPSPSSIMLTWTAPGDDGNTGTASRYDVRYAEAPITDDNWTDATAVADLTLPRAAGSPETFIVNGLTPNTTYYLGLKTADEAPNGSSISNVVAGTTSPAPAGNHVAIESKYVSGDAASVKVGIYVANDIAIVGLVLPLEFRAVTPGCYIAESCNFEVPAGNRIGASPLTGSVTRRILGVPVGAPCSGPTSNSYDTNSPVDFVSPDGFMWAGVSTAGSPDLYYLPPGNDYQAGQFADWPTQGQSTPYSAGPSFDFVFDVTGTSGTFEIDTCCVRPANHLEGTDVEVSRVFFTFSKGVITVR